MIRNPTTSELYNAEHIALVTQGRAGFTLLFAARDAKGEPDAVAFEQAAFPNLGKLLKAAPFHFVEFPGIELCADKPYQQAGFFNPQLAHRVRLRPHGGIRILLTTGHDIIVEDPELALTITAALP